MTDAEKIAALVKVLNDIAVYCEVEPSTGAQAMIAYQARQVIKAVTAPDLERCR